MLSLNAQQAGRIQGVIKDSGGIGFPDISVALTRGETAVDSRVTDSRGVFAFEGVTPGKYVVSFKATDGNHYQMDAEVSPGATLSLEKEITGVLGTLASVTVVSASRETEKLIDAPAAITIVDTRNKDLYGGAGQIPSMLAAVPGAELAQIGLYGYNFNLRGMNEPLNRRVEVLVDGRDAGVPFLGHPEWSSLSFLSNDIAAIEVLSGPSAALYGQNAYNGVVSVTTSTPRESPGGEVRITGGQLETVKLDAKVNTRLGRNWYLKAAAGYTGSSDFSRSRNVTQEYPGLPQEAIPLFTDHVDLGSGLVRVDKYFGNQKMLTLEYGAQSLSGPVFLVGVGRFLSNNFRDWTRAHLTVPGLDLSFYSNYRDSPDERQLGSGVPVFENDANYQGDVQWNRHLGESTSVLAGGSYRYENVTTANYQGMQTLLSHALSANRGSVYGQLRHTLGKRLTLTGAYRMDASALYSTQYSPRASAVYRLSSTQSLFASYGHAFEAPNYAELYVYLPIGLPIDLSPVEASLQGLTGGVPLGLGSVPIFAIGNEHLRVERVRSAEAGYKHVFPNRTLVTLGYYHNWMKDFISDLLPGVNPDYPPYQAPAALPPTARGIVSQTLNGIVPGLTNGPGGAPSIVYSQGNGGHVTSQGLEASVTGWLGSSWQYSSHYSWFFYNLNDNAARAQVHPNAPQHQAYASLGYRKPRFFADLRYRWVNGFDFSSGIFHGPVPTYNVVDFGATYRLSPHWEMGANIANLLNNHHYEEFGGDILRRLCLGYIAYSWK
jgi:iron complex outermembrane receptor protein